MLCSDNNVRLAEIICNSNQRCTTTVKVIELKIRHPRPTEWHCIIATDNSFILNNVCIRQSTSAIFRNCSDSYVKKVLKFCLHLAKFSRPLPRKSHSMVDFQLLVFQFDLLVLQFDLLVLQFDLLGLQFDLLGLQFDLLGLQFDLLVLQFDLLGPEYFHL